MACLKNRGGIWFARIRWTDEYKVRQEKQVPLRTKSRVTARHRIAFVNKEEKDIINGMSFSFPWMNDDGQTKVSVFRIKDAVREWMDHRIKNKIRKKTLEINQLALDYFMDCNGRNHPLDSIGNYEIANYIDYLDSKGNSDTTINIHLRTMKAMLRYFHKIDKMKRVPNIEQRKIPKTEPIYIPDQEFQNIMELDWLVDFYKRVFFLYRETGMRLREPFMSSLNGHWVDIPPESKSHAERSIELSDSLIQIFIELKNWSEYEYGSLLSDTGEHISKMFKKSLRSIGADENKRFHSLRHTYAVRMVIMKTPIHDIKLMMGHASVTTTEQYSRMNNKRIAQDFPTLVKNYSNNGKGDMDLWDIAPTTNGYVPIYKAIEG